ncbi:MAG: hypothetical protein K0S71_3036 [Clostridia bacterium]|nr:hypothetical protein [Clostridia bacterium]
MGLEKAVVKKQNKNGIEHVMEVQFNPSEYSVNHTAQYFEAIPIGRDAKEGRMQFKRSSFYEFKTTLYFDTYDTKEDVRKEIRKLESFLEKDPVFHMPDEMIFAWGEFTFIGRLQTVTQNYTMFHSNGNPIRAKVQIEAKGIISDGTSSSAVPKEQVNNTKVRNLTGIDELWMLAQKEYGNPNMWKDIARANGILNPRKHSRTKQLRLPSS